EAEIQRAEKQQSSVQNVEQMTPSMPATTPSSSIVADHSSDKAAKQTLLKVADFLAEQDFGIPLSIRLRRFAVWGSITSL
ncbi:type VI secretion system domain-containing protein, partial [Vibrio vulnificus]